MRTKTRTWEEVLDSRTREELQRRVDVELASLRFDNYPKDKKREIANSIKEAKQKIMAQNKWK